MKKKKEKESLELTNDDLVENNHNLIEVISWNFSG
jgi:hypothetical protein